MKKNPLEIETQRHFYKNKNLQIVELAGFEY